MNFSNLTRAASPLLQLHPRAQMHAQYSIFIIINAQMNLIGCSVFSFGTKDQGLKRLFIPQYYVMHSAMVAMLNVCVAEVGHTHPGDMVAIQL